MWTDRTLSGRLLGTMAVLVLLMGIGCNPQANPIASQTPGTSPTTPGDANTEKVETTKTHTPTPTQPVDDPTPTSTPLPPTATTTPSPSPVTTSTPTRTSTPTPTSTSTPTPTPALQRLTTGGCCTQHFWAPDSQQVLYIDQPAPGAALGIWGVRLTPQDAPPELLTERIAAYTSDLLYVIETEQNQTFIERLEGPLGESSSNRWSVPANGRGVSISPGRKRIAWGESNADLPFERRTTQVWIADFDGADAQLVATLPRGGFSGWISDDVVLLAGRESLESLETVVYTLSLTDGTENELVRAERPRGMHISPDGHWLVYYVSLSDEPSQNGFWVVRTDGGERRKIDRELFGAYQWRDAHRLILVPFQADAPYHELWEYDVETGAARRLTDSKVTPFKIANGDWQVSPDGRHVAFVDNSDRNIWVLTLVD